MFGSALRGGRRRRSDRSRPTRGDTLVHDPRPRPLLFVVHANRYTWFLIHAKKGPMATSPLTSRQTRCRWGYGVTDRAVCPVSR